MPFSCPLCQSNEIAKYHFQKKYQREFYICAVCDLRFIDRDKLLSLDQERERYDQHTNNIRTSGYESFLRRLANPVKANYPLKSRGLDFGCGPYPMLTEILNEDGFKDIDAYDPIFRNDKSYLGKNYDFITMCEVIEHIYNIKDDLSQVFSLLSGNGRLIISTGLYDSSISFEKWHYINDVTHINIMSEKTMKWITGEFKVQLESTENDITIFLKI